MTLIQLLQSGGVLRHRPPHGCYVVQAGREICVMESEVRSAIERRQVRPLGADQHGVHLFVFNQQGPRHDSHSKPTPAVPAVRRDPSVLPQGPAGVSNALPGVRALRGAVDSKDATPFCPGAGRAPCAQSSGAGRLDGARPQRTAVAGAGKGCVGCGGCGVMGVAV